MVTSLINFISAAEFSSSLVNIDVSQKKIDQNLTSYGNLLEQVSAVLLELFLHYMLARLR